MVRAARIPVFTYHAMNVAGNDYAMNDHAAFAQDIDALTRRGVRVAPLAEVVAALERSCFDDLEGCAALTLDDGSDFDFHDLPHPLWGTQPGMLRILREARERGGQPSLEATAFVIVSPGARQELDRTCMIGERWWNDGWWRAAESSGLMRIESHSWDHNHETLRSTVAEAPRGSFRLLTRRDADAEIAHASELLVRLRGRGGDVLFAYPYGEWSDFLAREYFPREGARHRVRAAFTTEPAPVGPGCDRWRIPRYVFGAHWRTPAQFERLLDDCFGRGTRARPAGSPSTAPFPFTLREVVAPDERVADLFRRSFGAALPDFPRHFVAERDGAPAGYVHLTQHEPGVFLVGGLCIDAKLYRRLSKVERAAVGAAGSLSRWLLSQAIDALGPRRAVFAYTGNTMSQRDTRALGFEPAGGSYLLAQWQGKPRDAALVARIAALGPF